MKPIIMEGGAGVSLGVIKCYAVKVSDGWAIWSDLLP